MPDSSTHKKKQIRFGINYSLPAVELQRQKRIHVDIFKLPAWPDLIGDAIKNEPVYIHFPLVAGHGIGDAWNTETKKPADWDQIERLLEISNTRCINMHLGPTIYDLPQIPIKDLSISTIDKVTDILIHDVMSVVKRFGPERVIVENVYDHRGVYLHQPFTAQSICRILNETGCGLLLDVSHARLAALCLNLDAREYTESLPVDRIIEMHVTGIQRLDEKWVNRLRQAGMLDSHLAQSAGHLQDHLPMTNEDWEFFAWVVERIHGGHWKAPELVSFEYGGIGSWWHEVTEIAVLEEQVPRFVSMLKAAE